MNRLLLGDNLPHLRSLPDESVDMVYLDPPFLTGREWDELDGYHCEDVSFDDRSFANAEPPPKEAVPFLNILSSSEAAYLTFMSLRLAELRRVLKPTGSIYLHCDSKQSHNLRVLMDLLFGRSNFRNFITWFRSVFIQNCTKHIYPRAADHILFYAKSDKAYFSPPRRPRDPEQDAKNFNKVDPDGRKYRWEAKGRGRDAPRIKSYLDEAKDLQVTDVWAERELLYGSADFRTGWPTEKPMQLMHRILEGGSREGDLVLDPFSGSGTTLVAAELLKRKWIGIEQNPEGARILEIKMREKAGGLFMPKWETVGA